MLAHTNQVPACLVAPSPSERGLGERIEDGEGVGGEDGEWEERTERILRLGERNQITIAIQKLKNIRK